MYEDFPRAKALRYLNLIHKVYPEIRLEEKRLRLPAWAYYKSRKSYDASAILNHYEAPLCKDGEYVMVLTNKDIYMEKENNGKKVKWGIMGLTNRVGGHCMIISTKRGTQRDINKVHLMIHEMGHAFGLRHCKDTNCLMHAYSGSDRFGTLNSFCPQCKKILMRKGWKL